MGGSRGGGGEVNPISPYYGGKEFSCINLTFKTDLASVDPAILAGVSVGDVYEVRADSERGPAYVSVSGKRLGTIIHPMDVKLLICLFEGTEYDASIISIEGGKCQVSISAKR